MNNLEHLGLFDTQINILRDFISNKKGIVIIAGVESSVREKTQSDIIEYFNVVDSPNIYQSVLTIDPKRKLYGAVDLSYIREHFLVSGEVYSAYELDYVQKSFQNGAITIVNIHSDCSLRVLERFNDFGLLNNNIPMIIIFQRSVPVLNQDNSIYLRDAPDSKIKKAVFDTDLLDFESIRIFKSNNDKIDNSLSINVSEFLIPDNEIIELMKQEKQNEAYNKWISLSDNNPYSEDLDGKTFIFNALSKLNEGYIDPNTYEEKFGYIHDLSKHIQYRI